MKFEDLHIKKSREIAENYSFEQADNLIWLDIKTLIKFLNERLDDDLNSSIEDGVLYGLIESFINDLEQKLEFKEVRKKDE